MSYKLFLGPLAEAWLRKNGIKRWQEFFRTEHENSDGEYVTPVPDQEPSDMLVQLAYYWSRLENTGTLCARIVAPQVLVEDNVTTITRDVARIDLRLPQMAQSMLESITGKPLSSIVEGEEWMTPSLSRYTADRFFDRGSRLDIFSTYQPAPAFIKVGNASLNREPCFAGMGKIHKGKR